MSESNFSSLGIGGNGGPGYAEEKVIKKNITSAQLLALNATPIELVPAPAAGNMIVFMDAVFHKPAGTAYAGIGAGEDLAIKYTDSSGAQVNTALASAGFLDQTTAQTRLTRGIVTEYTPVIAAKLVLHLLVGEITTGTSPLYVTVRYKVVKNVASVPTITI